jgi:hypothetical protein
VTFLSAQIFNVSSAAFVLVVILAIITHSVIDIARRSLDSLFYRRENRQLRANLRKLASLVGEEGLRENISLILDSMCNSVRATYGLIFEFEEFKIDRVASYHWRRRLIPVSRADLITDDVLHLDPNHYPPPLEEAALLIPLYVELKQFGAIVLGRPINGIRFSQDDVDLLLYPSDQVADAIKVARNEAEYLSELSKMTKVKPPSFEIETEIIKVADVEDALRNLFDYAYLGDSILANLELVLTRISTETVTHIDKGKVVNNLVTEAVEKLRPENKTTSDPPAREWYPYLILHGAYLEDKLNRDIMSQLYISEGTFNRTRRSAIRSVTRALEEMEAASS